MRYPHICTQSLSVPYNAAIIAHERCRLCIYQCGGSHIETDNSLYAYDFTIR